MGFCEDVKRDATFSSSEKMRISSFIQDYFLFFTDYNLKPSERVEHLFSNVDTPKQYFKKML